MQIISPRAWFCQPRPQLIVWKRVTVCLAIGRSRRRLRDPRAKLPLYVFRQAGAVEYSLSLNCRATPRACRCQLVRSPRHALAPAARVGLVCGRVRQLLAPGARVGLVCGRVRQLLAPGAPGGPVGGRIG
jgi:hypothetical protein